MTAIPTANQAPGDAAALRAVAEGHLKARRWADAADCLARLPGDDVATGLRLNLARNLAAMQRHRRQAYDTLMATPARGEYQVAATPIGKLSVMHQPSGMLMCVTHDPPAAADAQIARLTPSLDDGQAVGLLGIGDGYILDGLSRQRTRSSVGRTSALLLFEPSVDAITACLMLHDYTGPDGPIEQERVHWFVGPGWIEAYRRAAFDDLCLPSPQACLSVGGAGKAIHAGVQSVTHALQAYDQRLSRQVESHYAAVSRSDLLDAWASAGRDSGEKPRAMVKTSRFTTVLRYAAADVAKALTALGWEVRLVMESRDWQCMSVTALRRHVAEFRPHMVFAIDHVRREFGSLYPLQLPFVCWIQDDLPHLTTRETGQSLGPRDFVLTVSSSMYETHYDYPQRQCVTMTKLTRPPTPAPGSSESGGTTRPDIVFVSHAAADDATLIAQTIDAFADVPDSRPFVEACATRVVELYRGGGCLHTLGQMDRLVGQLQRDTGTAIVSPDVRDALLRRLMHPLNNALYRRQALRWVLDAARKLDARVELYGQGWDALDEFAPHAHGPVAYGDDLARLTRQARISLHVVPYFHLHQRLLDGLVAGGFFLLREHPSDGWRQRWRAFVETHLPREADTLDAARATLSPDLARQLDGLLAESHDTCLIHGYDNLASYRRQHAQGLGFLYDDLPRRSEVSFVDAAGVEGLLQRYLHDDAARAAVAAEQRAWVERHYTYEAGMARATAAVAALIAAEENDR
jgi:hypothetical protein